MEAKFKKAGDLLEGLGLPRPRLAESAGLAEPAADPQVIKTMGEFVELVELMRTAQNNFFESNGNRLYLAEARKLETRVDACIKARKERLARENQPESKEAKAE